MSQECFSEFHSALSSIQTDPFIGEPLSGNLTGIYKVIVGRDNPKISEYRILYSIYTSEQISKMNDAFDDCSDYHSGGYSGIVEILYIVTREDCNNLYRKSSNFPIRD